MSMACQNYSYRKQILARPRQGCFGPTPSRTSLSKRARRANLRALCSGSCRHPLHKFALAPLQGHLSGVLGCGNAAPFGKLKLVKKAKHGLARRWESPPPQKRLWRDLLRQWPKPSAPGPRADSNSLEATLDAAGKYGKGWIVGLTSSLATFPILGVSYELLGSVSCCNKY